MRWVLLLFSVGQAISSTAALVQLSPATAGELLEFRADRLPAVSNPFDPAQISIDGTFVSPSGKTNIIPGFWYQK